MRIECLCGSSLESKGERRQHACEVAARGSSPQSRHTHFHGARGDHHDVGNSADTRQTAEEDVECREPCVVRSARFGQYETIRQ